MVKLTNVASSASNLEPSSSITPQIGNVELARELARKVSMSFNNMRPSVQPPTVVIRSPKSRPSLSLEKGVVVMELTPEVSPSTSGETSGNSAGKQSAPARTNSTGMTSLDSKFSAGKMLSGHSSNTESKKAAVTKQQVAEETIVNNSLMPISEVAQEVMVTPEPVPSKSYFSFILDFVLHSPGDFQITAYCTVFRITLTPKNSYHHRRKGCCGKDIFRNPL